MNIWVTMTPEEYDLFRAYQKDKESLENTVKQDFYHLRRRHDELCTSLLGAVGEIKYAGEDDPYFEIEEQGHMSDAVDMAREWFA